MYKKKKSKKTKNGQTRWTTVSMLKNTSEMYLVSKLFTYPEINIFTCVKIEHHVNSSLLQICHSLYCSVYIQIREALYNYNSKHIEV